MGAAILILLVVGIVYSPCIHNGFIWDDNLNIFANSSLTEPGGLLRIWGTFDLYQYYPLTFTTFYIEHLLWGFNPLGYHCVNIILQAFNAMLVFLLLQRLGLSPPLSLFISTLFAIHPIQAESVAWATERKNLLSAFFYFSSLLLYLQFTDTGRYRLYGASLILFFAAILAKSVTVTLPATLIFLEFLRGKPFSRSSLVRIAPFLFSAIIMGMIAVYMEANRAGAAGDEFSFTLLQRMLVASRVFLFYPVKIILPFNMCFIYPQWKVTTGTLWDFWPLFLLSGIALILWRCRKAIPGIIWFSLGFYFVSLAPASGLINFYFMRYAFVQNHFQYIAGLGIMIILGIAGREVARNSSLSPKAGGLAGLIIAVGCGLLTYNQCGIYRSNEVLWNDTVSGNPACWMALNNLGVISVNQGKIKEGIDYYREALAINPGNIEAHNNLGAAYMLQGMLDKAIVQYNKSKQINPNLAQVHANLGFAYLKKGMLDEARHELELAITLNPYLAEAYWKLGSLMEVQGKALDAITTYREAIRHNPNHHKAYNNLAWLYATSPDSSIRNGNQAVALARKACALTGFSNPGTLDTLAAAYAEQGNFGSAIQYQQRAVDHAPPQFKTGFKDRLQRYKQHQAYRDH